MDVDATLRFSDTPDPDRTPPPAWADSLSPTLIDD